MSQLYGSGHDRPHSAMSGHLLTIENQCSQAKKWLFREMSASNMVYVADVVRKKILRCLDTYFFCKKKLCHKNMFWGPNLQFGKILRSQNPLFQNSEESSVKLGLKICFDSKGRMKWPKWPIMAWHHILSLWTYIFPRKKNYLLQNNF